MNEKNTTAHDIVNDVTIITSTRDNINWAKTFLKSFYQTAFNTEIPIIIVDASTNDNHLLLLNIVKEYPNVKVITSTNTHKHWVTDWEYGVGQCTTKYVISCHIDIVFLLEHWDLKLSDFLSTNILVAGSSDHIHINSSFLLSNTQLMQKAGFKTTYKEIANLEDFANEGGDILLLKCRGFQTEQTKTQYGDIFLLDNIAVYYHSYYSSRALETTSEPIPHHEYISSKIDARNLNGMPSILLDFLNKKQENKDINFIEFLVNQ